MFCAIGTNTGRISPEYESMGESIASIGEGIASMGVGEGISGIGEGITRQSPSPGKYCNLKYMSYGV
jgi:hypothetical protein